MHFGALASMPSANNHRCGKPIKVVPSENNSENKNKSMAKHKAAPAAVSAARGRGGRGWALSGLKDEISAPNRIHRSVVTPRNSLHCRHLRLLRVFFLLLCDRNQGARIWEDSNFEVIRKEVLDGRCFLSAKRLILPFDFCYSS